MPFFFFSGKDIFWQAWYLCGPDDIIPQYGLISTTCVVKPPENKQHIFFQLLSTSDLFMVVKQWENEKMYPVGWKNSAYVAV